MGFVIEFCKETDYLRLLRRHMQTHIHRLPAFAHASVFVA